ncbi:hypothetical protein CASFOL_016318 [Castilleja foliolosa]|uniref:non-specific serine/threonine protein kinase n=1 Tax=Castilleja foliolosa TaxID=1961234 RepID=A0ABD3DKF0_9LAMI
MKNSYSFFITIVFLSLLTKFDQFMCTRIYINPTTADQNSLLSIKNSITPDPYGVLANNWSTNTSVCNWIGVSCGTKHQRVISLNISGFALSGALPPHLGNLTFLRYLDTSSNNFTGPIPSELSRLYRLRVINVSYNLLTGTIPSWLGTLPQLEQIRLRNNTFSGTIPTSLFRNNSRLQILSLRYNSLNGSIPDEIGNCTSLQNVYFDYNELTGPIPYGIFNLSSIREIWIMGNHLSGSLPSDICDNLPNLTTLALSSNQIEGRIPRNIWKCRKLEILSLSYNGFDGEIPSEIGRLSMLRELYLGYYTNYTGGIPVEFGNLSSLEILDVNRASLTGYLPKEIGSCTSLREIYLDSNYLTGPIPEQIGNCSYLTGIYLGSNHFTGELPQELGNLKFLQIFVVSNNSLSGSIPSSIFNISTLQLLALSRNQFSGSLRIPTDSSSLSNLQVLLLTNNKLTLKSYCPGILQQLIHWPHSQQSPDQELGFLVSLTNCPLLKRLSISNNPLNGILPTSIGKLSTSLEYFEAESCNIKGDIPSTIGNLSSLQYLSLEGNQLTGLIPTTISKLNDLQRLYLSENQLQGYIPSDLCRLSNMGELYLNNNNLTGPIPECLGDVRSLRIVNLGSNQLSSNIPSDFWNLRDLLFLNLSSNSLSGELSSQIASLRVINVLDLSSNHLSGVIPGSIDGCQSLINLSLSNNKLDGSIPTSLGNIRGLSSLDLSNNNLSGSIPESLQSLNLLQYFNVSYNKLEGEVPTGGRFSNFTGSSFFNNSAFCGEERFQVPRCSEKDIRSSRLKLMKYILPPVASVIILATIIILVLIRRRRLKNVPGAVDISLGLDSWRRVSYIELVNGTNEFSETNLLGKGGFGSVFKGMLSDGLIVAVKVFNLQLERSGKSFETECEILSSVRHRNLVRIIGCCTNTEFKALILEYMTNGSLEKWLYVENNFLDLIQSLQIAIDVASALEYLHHGHTFPIVHCDIKPSNVLLDEDMVAHLADFGISKLFDDGESMVQTKTLGTIGYAAPEYGSEGKVSTNGDVYSYGILLLEIFTRKKPTDDMFSEEMSLKDWVNKALHENAVSEIVAPDLLAREDEQFDEKQECILSIFSLAMKCLVFSPDERINMIEIVAALHKNKASVVAGKTKASTI